MMPLAILGLGPGELILLILVIVIVFGVGKFPQIGSSLGRGLKNFRKGLRGDDKPDPDDKK
jgi:sec-independent protein translocase protein TatA